MRRKQKKKIIASLLSFMTALSQIPGSVHTVYAEENIPIEETEQSEEIVTETAEETEMSIEEETEQIPDETAEQIDETIIIEDVPIQSEELNELSDEYYFVTQPQSGSFDPSTLTYRCTWETSFTPLKVVIRGYSDGSFQNLTALINNLSANGSYDFPATCEYDNYELRAYFGTGEYDYVVSADIYIHLDLLKYVTQPQSGSYDPSTLSYSCTWETSFTPLKVVVRGYSDGSFQNLRTLISNLSANGSYDFPATCEYDKYELRAYFGTGEYDYAVSEDIYIHLDLLKYVTQPQSGSVDPSTLTYRCTWETSFTPLKVVIRGYSNGSFRNLTALINNLSANGSYDFPATCEYDKYELRAYFGTGEYDYAVSEDIYIHLDQLKYVTQPQSGSYDPSTLSYSCTWETSFTPLKVVVRGYSDGSFQNLRTLISNLSANGSYDFPATSEYDKYELRAYFGTGEYDYAVSEDIYIDLDRLIFVSVPEDGSFNRNRMTYHAVWETSFTPVKVLIRGFTNGAYETIATLSSNLTKIGSYEIPYSETYEKYDLAAYYGEEAYEKIYSSDFIVSGLIDGDTYGSCGMEGDNLTWEIADGVLTISGQGEMKNYNSLNVPWFCYRDEITEVVIEEGAASIGKCAFYHCKNLTEVRLPSTIEKIGDFAFFGCSKLNDVYLNMSRQKFLSEVTYNDASNSYFKNASKHFAWIADGQAGETLTWKLNNNGTLVFSGSGNMFDFGAAEDTPWYQYRNEILNLNLTYADSIGSYAFAECTKLTSVTLPPWLSSMGERAFEGCTLLSSVEFQNSGLEISKAAFKRCTSLVSVTIPKNAEYIDDMAFNMCTALTTVNIPSDSTMASIGSYAFSGCRNLKNITLPSSVTAISEKAFYNCQSLTSLTLPSSLTSMGLYCFANCSGLTGNLSVPASLTSIPANCFEGCRGINEVTLQPALTSVGTNAFGSCTSLAKVNYNGFRTDWDAVTVSDGNNALKNANFEWLYKSGKVDNYDIYWAVYGSANKLEIRGSGAMRDYTSQNYLYVPWYQYLGKIQTIDIHSSITHIGTNSFRSFRQLKTLYLPSTLESIGDSAFNESSALSDIWYDGSSVEWGNITIGTYNAPLRNAALHTSGIGGVVYDSEGAIDLYWTLDDAGVMRIDYEMDQAYTDIPDYRDERETPWYQYGDGNGQIIPMIKKLVLCEGVTGVGENAFASLTELTEVEIASSVTAIGDSAFAFCYNLGSIELPESIETLGTGIFWYCGSLEHVKFSEGITTIPYSTFYGCSSLNRVEIPSTLTAIDNNVFPGNTDFAGGDLWYNGTSQQWAAITKGSGNEALNTVTMHFITNEIAVNAVNFPDGAFRSYVSENIDTDRSGYLNDEEVQAVETIEIQESDISSLTGIGYFLNLEELYCGYNSLTSLDLSDNVNLKTLNADFNELESLSISELSQLSNLSIMGNSGITEIDLTGNPLLKELDVSECSLSWIDLTYNTELTTLLCSYNQLTTLDLWGLNELSYLECYGNQIEGLDLSVCSDLQYADVSENGMFMLTLGSQPYLKELYCNANIIRELDITQCPELLNAVVNEAAYKSVTDTYADYYIVDAVLRADLNTELITGLGIRIDEIHFPDVLFREWIMQHVDKDFNFWLSDEERESVRTIAAHDFEIESLEGIAYFPELTILNAAYNMISEVDLSGNEKLRGVNFDGNNLTSLDFSSNSDMRYIYLSENNLEELDVSMLESLSVLYCDNNQISTLDLSNNRLLIEACFDSNPLAEIDLSANANLTVIGASDCGLHELDVSVQENLERLDCYNNPLETLTLGSKENLTYLGCYEVPDTFVLDISECPKISDAYRNGTKTLSVFYAEYQKDGNILLIDEDQQVIAGEQDEELLVTARSANLVLQGRIIVQYKMHLSDPDNIKAVATITRDNGRTETIEVAGFMDSADETVYNFRIPMAAKEMGDNINLRFTDNEGNPVKLVTTSGRELTEGADYSVNTYLNNKLSDSDADLRTLCTAMKAFGQYSQILFNYRTDEIGTLLELDEVDLSDLSDYGASRTGTEPAGITVSAVNMILESETTVNFKLSVQDDQVSNYTYTLNGSTVTPVHIGNEWIIRKENIVAKDLDVMQELVITDGTDTVTYRYGGMSYCYNNLRRSTTAENLKNLCRAMYWYNQAANTYFE